MKPTKLFPAEHVVVIYHHTPELGLSLKDILEPSYWVHVAPQLRVGHRIEIMAPDGDWWAMLIVRAVGRTEAVVQELQYVKLGEPTAKVKGEENPYKIVWRGPARKFGIVRKSDKEVVKDEFQVREHAEKWLKNHLKNMAA